MPRPRTVIVGAGIVGLTTAYFLARAGREVIVLDREEIGEGASCGNAGLLSSRGERGRRRRRRRHHRRSLNGWLESRLRLKLKLGLGLGLGLGLDEWLVTRGNIEARTE
jgi:glycine/D-amino acid oxidase-like deaminating enzyme